MCKKVGCIILIIVFFIFLCGSCSATIFFSNRYSPTIPDDDPFAYTLPTITVEGSLGYPSEFIPPLAICAESPNNDETVCTYQMLEDDSYEYKLRYELDITPGEYYIYSVEVDDEKNQLNDYKAYYSEFVECGMDVSCTSHEPILIVVDEADEKIEDIDPIDWYAPI